MERGGLPATKKGKDVKSNKRPRPVDLKGELGGVDETAKECTRRKLTNLKRNIHAKRGRLLPGAGGYYISMQKKGSKKLSREEYPFGQLPTKAVHFQV